MSAGVMKMPPPAVFLRVRAVRQALLCFRHDCGKVGCLTAGGTYPPTSPVRSPAEIRTGVGLGGSGQAATTEKESRGGSEGMSIRVGRERNVNKCVGGLWGSSGSAWEGLRSSLGPTLQRGKQDPDPGVVKEPQGKISITV